MRMQIWGARTMVKYIDEDSLKKSFDRYPPEIRAVIKKEIRLAKPAGILGIVCCEDCISHGKCDIEDMLCDAALYDDAYTTSYCSAGVRKSHEEQDGDVDTAPVRRCWDCCYWRDEVMVAPDGKVRVPTDQDKQKGRGIKKPVCLYGENKHNGVPPAPREWYDYCSRWHERVGSYEDWYGIKDGVYPQHIEEGESDAD